MREDDRTASSTCATLLGIRMPEGRRSIVGDVREFRRAHGSVEGRVKNRIDTAIFYTLQRRSYIGRRQDEGTKDGRRTRD